MTAPMVGTIGTIDPDSVAPMYTLDKVEIVKDMDIYVCDSYDVKTYKIIALSRVNRYIIFLDRDNDEHKHKFTDEHKLELYSTLEQAKQAKYKRDVGRLQQKKDYMASQMREINEMEEKLLKDYNELNADKFLAQVILGEQSEEA